MSFSKKNSAGYGFVAPEIEDDRGKSVKTVFPTGEKIVPILLENKCTVDVRRDVTVVDIKGISEDTTIELRADRKNLNIGSRVVVRALGKNETDGCSLFVEDTEENIVGGTFLTVTVQNVMEFIWDGDRFLMVGEQEVPWEE